jgi:hypothetical protein
MMKTRFLAFMDWRLGPADRGTTAGVSVHHHPAGPDCLGPSRDLACEKFLQIFG